MCAALSLYLRDKPRWDDSSLWGLQVQARGVKFAHVTRNIVTIPSPRSPIITTSGELSSAEHASPNSSGSLTTFYTPSPLIPTEAPCPDPVLYQTEYPGTPTMTQLAWDPVPTMSALAYPIPPVPMYRQILLYFHRNHSYYQ